jgi:hypothetical protein
MSYKAFKHSFLTKCASHNLSETAILQHIEKVAASLKQADPNVFSQTAKDLYNTYRSGYGSGGKGSSGPNPYLLLTALSLAPAAVAGAGGYMARKLQGDYLNPEDAKKQELIDTYRTLAQKSRRAESSSLGLS